MTHKRFSSTESLLDQLRAGDIAGGTRRFVEEVALGPGMWEQLPEEDRQTFINNAPTFLDESKTPSGPTSAISRATRPPPS